MPIITVILLSMFAFSFLLIKASIDVRVSPKKKKIIAVTRFKNSSITLLCFFYILLNHVVGFSRFFARVVYATSRKDFRLRDVNNPGDGLFTVCWRRQWKSWSSACSSSKTKYYCPLDDLLDQRIDAAELDNYKILKTKWLSTLEVTAFNSHLRHFNDHKLGYFGELIICGLCATWLNHTIVEQ